MDHKRVHDQIIERARIRSIDVFETHHIVPRSLGGTNEPENLVKLTPREHYIVHMLLVKMHTGKSRSKMAYALFRMSQPRTRGTTYIANSNQYEFARKQHSLAQSERMMGNTFAKSQKGKPKLRTEEHQRNLNASIKISNTGKSPANKGQKADSKICLIISSATKESMQRPDVLRNFLDGLVKRALRKRANDIAKREGFI